MWEGGDEPERLPTYWLWPCNAPVWRIWGLVQTQWRTGMAGATGLDHTAVWATLRELVHSRQQRHEAFEDICAMERATLEEWQAQRPAR